MSRFILAVSGGVDSVVLMEMFDWPEDTIVAHFDHGIRPSSSDDCAFVRRLAERHGWSFVFERAALGASCSEELARRRRYDFLFRTASNYRAELVTAHHADDCIETVAINLLRGTGWRGLSPLSNPRVFRPMLQLFKSDIYRFAAEKQLIFRLDQTNNDTQYLRNRLRERLRSLSTAQKQQLLALYHAQLSLKTDIEQALQGIVGTRNYLPRRLFNAEIDDARCEILRFFLASHGIALTRPQTEHCLAEIVKFTPGKKYSLDKTHFLQADRQNYRIVEK